MLPIDDELREIRREIVESRSLVIKTNNLTSGLAADLKTISKRQSSFERRALYNSAIAYVLFVVVVLGVVKVAYDARIEVNSQETNAAKEKVKVLEVELKKLRDNEDRRRDAEVQAQGFLELIRSGKKRDVIEGFDKLKALPLSRAETTFLSDALERTRSELSIESYQSGLEHVRAGRFNEAAASFEESIRMKDNASHTPSAKLELGRVLKKIGRPREAIPYLSQISTSSTNKDVLDDAMMLMAECQVDVQAWSDAKATLRSFIQRFPDSPFLNDARMLLADINLKH